MKFVVDDKSFDNYDDAKAYEEEVKKPQDEELKKVQDQLTKLNAEYKSHHEALTKLSKEIFELEMQKLKFTGDKSDELNGILSILKLI